MTILKFIHTEPNEAEITELFAYLSTDDTGEGICGANLYGDGTPVPLVTSKRRIAETLMKRVADDIARISGKPVRLVRFKRVDD